MIHTLFVFIFLKIFFNKIHFLLFQRANSFWISKEDCESNFPCLSMWYCLRFFHGARERGRDRVLHGGGEERGLMEIFPSMQIFPSM